MAYRLTVRAGSGVSHETFEDLGEAIEALERRAKDVRAAGPLPARKMLREFEPARQVAGRLELSTGGVLRRGRTAGIDVMGDGTLVVFEGGMRREPVEPGDDSPWAVVRNLLEKP